VIAVYIQIAGQVKLASLLTTKWNVLMVLIIWLL